MLNNARNSYISGGFADAPKLGRDMPEASVSGEVANILCALEEADKATAALFEKLQPILLEPMNEPQTGSTSAGGSDLRNQLRGICGRIDALLRGLNELRSRIDL